MNVLEHSVYEWPSNSSVRRCFCNLWCTFSWSTKESDSIKYKIVSRSSPNGKSVLDAAIFSNFYVVLSQPPDVFQPIAESNKKRWKHPDYHFSYDYGGFNENLIINVVKEFFCKIELQQSSQDMLRAHGVLKRKEDACKIEKF